MAGRSKRRAARRGDENLTSDSPSKQVHIDDAPLGNALKNQNLHGNLNPVALGLQKVGTYFSTRWAVGQLIDPLVAHPLQR